MSTCLAVFLVAALVLREEESSSTFLTPTTLLKCNCCKTCYTQQVLSSLPCKCATKLLDYAERARKISWCGAAFYDCLYRLLALLWTNISLNKQHEWKECPGKIKKMKTLHQLYSFVSSTLFSSEKEKNESEERFKRPVQAQPSNVGFFARLNSTE